MFASSRPFLSTFVVPGFRTAIISIILLAPMTVNNIASAQDDVANEFADEPAGGEDAAAAGQGNAQPTATGADAPAAEKSLLVWIKDSLGLGYLLIFFLLSVTLVSLFVMNILAARRDTLCPQYLVDEFEEKLNEKDIQGAYDLARTDESVLGQVLSAGLAKLSKGYNKALEGMQEGR